jgi:hypothetical protein
MKKILIAVAVLSIFIISCQREPDGTIDNRPTGVDSLPYKIVEIDRNNDSAVALLSYNSSGRLETIYVQEYHSGVVTERDNAQVFYYPDGQINHAWWRWRDLTSGDVNRVDIVCPKDGSGRLAGQKVIDSAGAYTTYYRFAYDNKNRLARVLYDIDSVNFFATAMPVNFRYVDSVVYDSEDRITEYYDMIFNLTPGSNVYEQLGKDTYSNFQGKANHLPSGLNSYILFENLVLLGESIPGEISMYFPGGPVHSTGTITVTRNSDNRPTKISSNFTVDPYWFYSLFIPAVKETNIYY